MKLKYKIIDIKIILAILIVLFFSITLYSEEIYDRLNKMTIPELTEVLEMEVKNKELFALIYFVRSRKFSEANRLDDAMAYRYRGFVYIELKKDNYLELAYNDFVMAFDKEPELHYVAFATASMAKCLKKYDKALYYLEQALKSKDKMTLIYSYHLKALVCFIIGEWKDVEESINSYFKYRTYLDNSNDTLQAYIMRSLAYIKNKKYLLAENDINSALKINSNEGTMYFIRSVIYYKLANNSKSINEKEKYNKLSQKDLKKYQELDKDAYINDLTKNCEKDLFEMIRKKMSMPILKLIPRELI